MVRNDRSAASIEWYNMNAGRYAHASSPFANTVQIDEFLGSLPRKGTVLDVGCAAGRDTVFFVRRGFHVVGIDLSHELLRLARRRVPKARFVQADFRKIPFPSRCFDGVWAHAALVHLESDRNVIQALKEFRRVLRLGGMLHLFVKHGRRKTATVPDSLTGDTRFFRYFTITALRNMLAHAGLRVKKLEIVADLAGRDTPWIYCLVERR
jgi:ubiquinone/menaquinone biosynthesis C-methylase UbiE